MKIGTVVMAMIGMTVTLTVIGGALKLAHWGPVAGWSWWTIYAPVWGPWAFLLVGSAAEYGLRKLASWGRK